MTAWLSWPTETSCRIKVVAGHQICKGTCYEPGEFCRNSDYGVHVVAGDGEQIVCADNDGWRWEPV